MIGRKFEGPEHRSDLVRVLLYILIAAGVYVLLQLMWQVREALLLTFIAAVFAVLLSAGAAKVRGWTGLSNSWALAIIALFLLSVIALLSWLIGSQVQTQIFDLLNRLPQAVRSLEQRLGLSFFGLGDEQGGSSSLVSGIQWLAGRLVSVGQYVAGAISGIILVIVGSFFFAADPKLYRSGFIKLFPKSQHARVEETLHDCGNALLLWLKAQLISMALVGLLTGLGTWLIGLPSPLALGLFAGITEFIPIIGPIIGAVPAVLLALTQGGSTVLWTILLFLGIQQLESNVITPIVERRTVTIPPGLLLFAVVAVGLVFGVLGIIIAAPLTVVLYVVVKKLYVRQMLGEETPVPGESASEESTSKAAD